LKLSEKEILVLILSELKKITKDKTNWLNEDLWLI
jgi:hypothetical protein